MGYQDDISDVYSGGFKVVSLHEEDDLDTNDVVVISSDEKLHIERRGLTTEDEVWTRIGFRTTTYRDYEL